MPRIIITTILTCCICAAAADTDTKLAAEATRLADTYPGLRSVNLNYQLAELADGIQGTSTASTILISQDLATDLALAVYRHEVGHQIYLQLSQDDKESISREIASTNHQGWGNGSAVHEIFSDLFSYITGGRIMPDLPQTQRIIRRRLYR